MNKIKNLVFSFFVVLFSISLVNAYPLFNTTNKSYSKVINLAEKINSKSVEEKMKIVKILKNYVKKYEKNNVLYDPYIESVVNRLSLILPKKINKSSISYDIHNDKNKTITLGKENKFFPGGWTLVDNNKLYIGNKLIMKDKNIDVKYIGYGAIYANGKIFNSYGNLVFEEKEYKEKIDFSKLQGLGKDIIRYKDFLYDKDKDFEINIDGKIYTGDSYKNYDNEENKKLLPGVFSNKKHQIDGESFRFTSDHYAVDKNNVYSNFLGFSKIGKNKGFKDFKGGYLLNGNKIYYLGTLTKIDGKTFGYLTGNFSYDKDNFYNGGNIIGKKGKEVGEVKYLGNMISPYKGKILCGNKSFDKNIEYFSIIGREKYDKFYTKDKRNIYYGCYIIEGADLETFEIIEETISKDKNNYYQNGGIFTGIDLKHFLENK